ncbi:MAG: hypothetical protein KDK30_04505 [Leptospiraceae bacterium]|nr:hypothetical protein [Leptospiraceae bacterium]
MAADKGTFSKKELKEVLKQEITLIQDVIKRMASNSFMIKGWTVTVVAITLLLRGDRPVYAAVAFLPTLVFWGLDGYFLRQEILYRKLYDWVIANRLTSAESVYDLKPQTRFKSDVSSWLCVTFSGTLWPFYGMVLLLVVIYWIYSTIESISF